MKINTWIYPWSGCSLVGSFLTHIASFHPVSWWSVLLFFCNLANTIKPTNQQSNKKSLANYLKINVNLRVYNMLSLFQSGLRSNHSTSAAQLKFSIDVLSGADNVKLEVRSLLISLKSSILMITICCRINCMLLACLIMQFCGLIHLMCEDNWSIPCLLI